MLSYTVKHLCSPHTWSYATQSTTRPVVACPSDISGVQTSRLSQVCHGSSVVKPVSGWEETTPRMSCFRTSSPTSCWKRSPQQIESAVSCNYFSRCHYQKFLCKYIFYSLRHVNMRPKLYNTERKTECPFLLVVSVFLGASYRLGQQRCSLRQNHYIWYPVCTILGMWYRYSIA